MNAKTNGKSQKEQIKNAMLACQTLTCLTALQKFGCLNLRNRICEIAAEKQHKITKVWYVTKTKKRILKYSIAI